MLIHWKSLLIPFIIFTMQQPPTKRCLQRSITEYERVLPIHINVTGTNFDSSLYSRPSRLRDFIYKHIQYNSQEIFDLQKRHTLYTLHTSLPYRDFFSNAMVNIFAFTSSIISMITIILVVCLY